MSSVERPAAWEPVIATVHTDGPLVVAAVKAIYSGDVRRCGACWPVNPGVATARLVAPDQFS